MRDFLAACTKVAPCTRMQARPPLYDVYITWCGAQGRSPLSLTMFGHAITAVGVQKEAKARIHYLDLALVA